MNKSQNIKNNDVFDISNENFNGVKNLSNKHERIVVFSLKLAQKMLENGCKLVSIDHNSVFYSKIVFYFEQDEVANKIMSQYKPKNRK